MDILASILEKWDKEKSVENLISEGLFSNQDAIQSSLDRISSTEREYVLAQLDEIENAVRKYITSIENDKASVQKQIDATYKSEKACISYGSSIDIQKKGKEE